VKTEHLLRQLQAGAGKLTHRTLREDSSGKFQYTSEIADRSVTYIPDRHDPDLDIRLRDVKIEWELLIREGNDGIRSMRPIFSKITGTKYTENIERGKPEEEPFEVKFPSEEYKVKIEPAEGSGVWPSQIEIDESGKRIMVQFVLGLG